MSGRRIASIAILLPVLGIFVLLLLCLGIAPPPLIFALELAIGWYSYLHRTIPNVKVSPAGIATAAACVAGVLVLGHLLAGWMWREMGPTTAGTPRWRLRWTVGLVAGVVLMFVCGIAAVGAAHQAAWLARSPHPVFSRSRPETQRIRCASNMRQIGQALVIYAEANDGRLPDSLDLLLLHLDITAEVFVCPATYTERAPGATPEELARNLPHHCDYVYHGRGLVLPLPPGRPILCEPLHNHEADGMNILFGNGRVEFMSPAKARRVMEQLDDSAGGGDGENTDAATSAGGL